VVRAFRPLSRERPAPGRGRMPERLRARRPHHTARPAVFVTLALYHNAILLDILTTNSMLQASQIMDTNWR
jgi:hypothetical protein